MKDGGPAFPDMRRLEMLRSINITPEQKEVIYGESSGMSLRDYFAAKAMASMAANDPRVVLESDWAERVAVGAYRYAAAMLKAREQ